MDMSILPLHRRRADSCLSRKEVSGICRTVPPIFMSARMKRSMAVSFILLRIPVALRSWPICLPRFLSRPVDFSIYDVVFASAQKNLGPAGVTLLIVREDLIGYASPFCPSVFDWKNVVESDSMFNTPPTYAIYICGLVFRWLKKQGGVSRMERESIEKSSLLYDFIDRSDFYRNDVETGSRSRMNVPFFLEDESLNDRFVMEASAHGLFQLKGHRFAGRDACISIQCHADRGGQSACCFYAGISNRGIGDCTMPKLGNWAVMPYNNPWQFTSVDFSFRQQSTYFLSMEKHDCP